ncbi:MAG TPA: glutathione S-transferase family protein [Steroidobacteraceae bacterium]|nr:glutathione S-transferase family protein [Steroidobacteraceae bacterium]
MSYDAHQAESIEIEVQRIMYELYIGNKNYSSWSLRPWVLMRHAGIAFTEHLVPFGDTAAWNSYRNVAPNGKVPCLLDRPTIVWDSLAIIEYLAEKERGVWPAEPSARAWARCAAAEMHSGFTELRSRCSMNCGVRVRLKEFPAALEREIARLGTLWQDGLRRFGGPFLAGGTFTAVDAFFAPVAFRIQTYGLPLDAASAAYAARLRDLPAMREWYKAGLEERFRDEPHELEIRQAGVVTEDLRRQG